MSGIPKSTFPVALDSEYTLFLTRDGTQSVIVKDLKPDDKEIRIVPSEGREVWPDNGFATIGDELLYYDSSERDGNGKICKLCGCIRKVEGEIGDARGGEPIYGMAVAQHHNQLVDAIINIERVMGDISALESSLGGARAMSARGSHRKETMSLRGAMASLLGCAPAADDACPDVSFVFTELTSTLGEFCVRIDGDYDTYRLDFGDGSFTTDTFEGSHSYTTPSLVAPSVTVTNSGCTLVLTPETAQPGCDVAEATLPSPAFGVPIPSVPALPLFIVPRTTCPEPVFSLPPLATQLSVTGGGGSCSDIAISITDCCIPSAISVIGCNFPSAISVAWGTPPTVTVMISCVVPPSTPSSFAMRGMSSPGNIIEGEEITGDIPVTFEDLGIPREIKVIAPPHIKIIHDIPKSIPITATSIPKSIPLDASMLPRSILVEPAPNFPSIMKMDIKVTGVPDSIELRGPSTIQLVMPENPFVEMRYSGEPIKVKVELDPQKLIEAGIAIVSPK